MSKPRKVIKSFQDYRRVCQLTTLCDICDKKEECPVYKMFYETKQAAWESHNHSIRFELPECSEFTINKKARQFRGKVK